MGAAAFNYFGKSLPELCAARLPGLVLFGNSFSDLYWALGLQRYFCFIRRARDLGFSVDQMTDLLALWSDRSRASADVKRIAMEHVAELERKMRELRDMSKTLRHLAEHCQGDGRPLCPIIEELSSGVQAGAIKPPNRPKLSGDSARHRQAF